MATPLADSERNIILLYESEVIYNKFRQVFGDRYNIFWGKDLNSTMDILGSRTVGVMVCDIHFQNQDIYPVVLALRTMHPELITMIVTQSQNAHYVADLELKEEIFAALVRPVSQVTLNRTLDNAFQYYLDNRKALVEEIRAKEAADEAAAAASGQSVFAGMTLSEIIAQRVHNRSGQTMNIDTAIPSDILSLENIGEESVLVADATEWLDEFDVSLIEESEPKEADTTLEAGQEYESVLHKTRVKDQFFEEIEYDDE